MQLDTSHWIKGNDTMCVWNRESPASGQTHLTFSCLDNSLKLTWRKKQLSAVGGLPLQPLKPQIDSSRFQKQTAIARKWLIPWKKLKHNALIGWLFLTEWEHIHTPAKPSALFQELQFDSQSKSGLWGAHLRPVVQHQRGECSNMLETLRTGVLCVSTDRLGHTGGKHFSPFVMFQMSLL